MIEEAQDFIPIWMLLSAAFGFIVGEAYGDQARHRKCLEQANADLRDLAPNCPHLLAGDAKRTRSAAPRHQRHPPARRRCDKKPRKTTLLNPTKSTAGSPQSGCDTRYTLKNRSLNTGQLAPIRNLVAPSNSLLRC